MSNQSLPLDAILYGRVSTNKQEMSRQDFMMAEYCDRINANPILAENDEAVSGSIPFAQRRGGRAILQAIAARKGRPFVFITTEQDRVGRDTVDQIQTIRAIWNAGGTPHFTAEGGARPRSPESEMNTEIRATMGQYEKNKIQQRINDTMRAKRAAGQLCGKVPFGFNAEPTGEKTVKGVAIHRLVPNPDEQKWILHMVQLRRAGLGYHSIAKDLNSHGVPTKNRGKMMNLLRDGCTKAHVEEKFASGKWQCGNVESVLNNVTVQAWLASLPNAAAA